MTRQILIIKQDGEKEFFDTEKLRTSLKNSRASDKNVEDVIKIIEKELKDSMTTSEIYKLAFSYLKKIEKPIAARYSLKRAVLAFGPSGYPFENFIAELFRAIGYENIKVGVMVQGECVEHEVDILAEKDGKRIGAEIKFHNELGIVSDLKTALYVHSRFEDIRKREKKEGIKSINEDWLITNTRFSSNAIKYAECVGMKIMSWNYPKGGELFNLIEKAGIHPITALTTLTQTDKNKLLQKEMVLCRNLKGSEEILKEIGIKSKKIEDIMKESSALCNI